jgi:hypothetical protein
MDITGLLPATSIISVLSQYRDQVNNIGCTSAADSFEQMVFLAVRHLMPKAAELLVVLSR